MIRSIESICNSISIRFRRYFVTGFLLVVPVAATVLVMKWLFDTVDSILAPSLEKIFGRDIPGIGLIAIIVLIYLAGIVATNVIGRRLFQHGESLLIKVPMVRELYNTFKQVLESVMMPQKGGFKEVVMVEFPTPGMSTIGFITNRLKDDSEQELVSVYIPTTPNPTSGFMEIIPSKDIKRIAMSVEDAIKMIVSGGMVSPEVIRRKAEPL